MVITNHKALKLFWLPRLTQSPLPVQEHVEKLRELHRVCRSKDISNSFEGVKNPTPSKQAAKPDHGEPDKIDDAGWYS